MKTSRMYAFVVGIGNYRWLNLLSKTIADAQDVYDFLKQRGYPAAQSALLLDGEATKVAINNGFDWFARNVATNDVFLFFFSGHGARYVGGFNPGEYLCPVGADPSDFSSTSISDGELSTVLRAIKASRIVVMLDACHSGGVGTPRNTDCQARAGFSEATYGSFAEGHGRVVMASCRPDEVSWELPNMRNGLFTHYLLEGLRGAAADPDGIVRILDLFKYVSARVPERHSQQHPFFKGEMDLNFAVAASGSALQGLPASHRPNEPNIRTDFETHDATIEQERIRELVEIHRRRLHVLEKRVALEGRDARPADEIEIESIKQRLSELDQLFGV